MLRKTGSHRSLTPTVKPPPPVRPKPVAFDEVSEALEIREEGPGKNVLVRKRLVREDTGTHETLKLLDDSIVDDNDASGIDPYNTGRFDRSKHWDKRFRK